MPRSAALKPEQVPADSKPTLDAFTKNIGFTPNMLATFAQSPIAFNAWAALLGSLSKALDVKTRDSIGLAVSEVNGCNYCLTVHSFTAEQMAKLPTDEIILARKGHASDPKRDAAVQFARKVIETRGKVSDADLKAVRDAGYTDANLMQIVALVAMYSLTNFFSITCSIPRTTFQPLLGLARSELYPVASTFSESARRRRAMRGVTSKPRCTRVRFSGTSLGLSGCNGKAGII
jgi:uncharacterized peroxidase-related enzyme